MTRRANKMSLRGAARRSNLDLRRVGLPRHSLRLVPRNDRTDVALRDPRTFVTRGERETERIASEFAKTLRGGEIILLDGDLGAGKTVFVRGIAKGLGVRGRIASPTFVLMRIHEVDSRKPIAGSNRKSGSHDRHAIGYRLSAIGFLIHVDAYRVRDPQELEAIGLLDWIGRPDTVIAIEWGERMRRYLRGRVFGVRLEQVANRQEQRRISIALSRS